jgi:endonuclease/exonuclease/phosphatase family metal-dependent hydrolase
MNTLHHALAPLFLTAALSLPAAEVGPSVEISPLVADSTLPAIPCVKYGDTSWTLGPRLFAIADSATKASAQGWMAASDSAILLKVVVNDDVHSNTADASHIYDGDGIQIGVDGRGDGAFLTPRDALELQSDDASYGFGLTPSGVKAYMYHSGYRVEKGVGDLVGGDSVTLARAAITRNETAKTTTYLVTIPWTELHIPPAATPLVGVSVVVNNGSGKARRQYSWGTFAGGQFRPGLFKQVRVSWPATGRNTILVTNDKLWTPRDQGEMVAVLGTGKPVGIRVVSGPQEANVSVPASADAGATRWYRVRLDPGIAREKQVSMRVTVAMGAAVVTSQSAVLASVGNGLLARPQLCNTVVSGLSKIRAEKRQELRTNPKGKSRAELNAAIPELRDIEVANTFSTSAAPETLCVAAWNCEFGTHWKEAARLFQEQPMLKPASIILLSESDYGVGRSGNVNSAKELAAALKMNYAYAVEFVEFDGGIARIGDSAAESTFGYTGNAILSRFPLGKVRMVRFPQMNNAWYGGNMRRLGGRMALLASVTVGRREITLVSTHLESNTGDPRHGVYIQDIEVGMVLAELSKLPASAAVVLGGDFNARPQEGIFPTLARAGFDVAQYNDTAVGTVMDSGNGLWVAMQPRIDYLLGRGVKAVNDFTSPVVIPAVYPSGTGGACLSDHAIVAMRVLFASPPPSRP